MNFKVKIKKFIEDNKLTKYSFSKKADIPQSVTENILNSKSPNPTIETAIKLAKTLGCSLDELFLQSNYENIKINTKLAKSVLSQICDSEDLESIQFWDFWEIFYNIYTYSIENNLKHVDKKYAAWYIKKVYGNTILT